MIDWHKIKINNKFKQTTCLMSMKLVVLRHDKFGLGDWLNHLSFLFINLFLQLSCQLISHENFKSKDHRSKFNTLAMTMKPYINPLHDKVPSIVLVNWLHHQILSHRCEFRWSIDKPIAVFNYFITKTINKIYQN